MTFDSYSLVLLRKGPAWDDADTAENAALQAAHLAHFDALIAEGKMKLAGPFSERDDPSLRGLCLYATSVEEARALANADPRVLAGHLVVEAMRFHTKEGALAFPLDG